MAFDLWTYQFCLACDKQVQSDAATYCSEPCQMIDSERATLPPSSQVSSPGFPPPPTELYVSWAYGPSTARSCETTAQKRHWIHYMMPDTEQVSSFVATQNLKHANSHSSLGSMQSTSSTRKAGHLSNKARMELRAYAVLFEQATVQRRRSY
ncbi:Zinc binding protein Ecl1/2/3 [Fusarium oxysporum f. sp. vasinfectum]|nr:Zinc binding protein Ecl1/2/3 [Fusarium oxysporum f. sp. vasinfectum]